MLFFSSEINAQKEYNMWYFGDRAGINFNTNPPSALYDSRMSTSESSTSICDSNGNLLFYTNGDTIYNRNHQYMLNWKSGLSNSMVHSSVQGSLALPMPGSKSLYYLFLRSYMNGGNDDSMLRYWVIDMSLDGGYGEVVEKDKPLILSHDENFALTSHTNNQDYWIGSMRFNVFTCRRTVNGYFTSPYFKQYLNFTPNSNPSPIKFSPNSKILFSTSSQIIGKPYSCVLNLYKFNNSNGQLSQHLKLPMPDQTSNVRSIEFSPDSKLVYITVMQNVIGNRFQDLNLYQFNISNWDSITVQSSLKLINSQKGLVGGIMSLQLGPDGKIYCFNLEGKKLSVIKSPNIPGLGCNYINNAIDLGGKTNNGGGPYYPTFWFGIRKSNSEKDTTYLNLGNDTVLCYGDSLKLVCQNAVGNKFEWNTGDTTESIVIKDAGNYKVKITSLFGEIQVGKISIKVNKKIKVYLGSDTAFCGKFTHLLKADVGAKKYNWSNGDTTVSILINKPNWYSVAIKDSNNCDAGDTILIDQLLEPEISLNYDSITCKYVFISVIREKELNYLWSTGDTGTTIKIDKKGNYQLKTFNKFCDVSKNIFIDKLPLDSIYLGKDTILCGDELVLKCKDSKSFEWNTGEQTRSIKVIKSGIYWVKSKNNGCIVSDSIKVEFDCDTMTYFIPNAFSPNGDKNNDLFRVTGSNIDNINIVIFNRWGEKIIETSGIDPFWDGSYLNSPCKDDAYFYMIFIKGKKPSAVKYLSGTVTLLR